ncbi:MAG: endonuclease/exonuclease/phosphatase family protein [Flavobacteriaceae bacterium]|nr:endonuclease/exonuclease/phosphatase family protein [Flavobacteriaceae bacterium]
MKKLSLFNKIIYFINSVFALLLLLSMAIPYIEPKASPIISVLSLAVPFLIFAHIIFIIYWIVNGIKKQFFLSAICILLTIFFSYFPYKFSDKKEQSDLSFSVMTYNVQFFNRYHWRKNEKLPNIVPDFIAKVNPDIIAFQEYYNSKRILLNFPYKYIEPKEKINFGLAIYSKYKIINKGSLNFKNSTNNAIFVDILKEKDTLRVYSVHLESIGIKDEQNSEKLLRRLTSSFAKQQPQVEQILAHTKKCNYKIIICGDFNNTAYSWVYNKMKGDFKDTFLEAGKGFGKTFGFHRYPLRIDFILVDERIEVNEHQNFNVKFSDHEPVLAKLDF